MQRTDPFQRKRVCLWGIYGTLMKEVFFLLVSPGGLNTESPIKIGCSSVYRNRQRCSVHCTHVEPLSKLISVQISLLSEAIDADINSVRWIQILLQLLQCGNSFLHPDWPKRQFCLCHNWPQVLKRRPIHWTVSRFVERETQRLSVTECFWCIPTLVQQKKNASTF